MWASHQKHSSPKLFTRRAWACRNISCLSTHCSPRLLPCLACASVLSNRTERYLFGDMITNDCAFYIHDSGVAWVRQLLRMTSFTVTICLISQLCLKIDPCMSNRAQPYQNIEITKVAWVSEGHSGMTRKDAVIIYLTVIADFSIYP